ncbi:MAG: phosphotransferase [Parcubacteria group bacterium]|nr:phosphotransferase [Parcubacteria group bacterium]
MDKMSIQSFTNLTSMLKELFGFVSIDQFLPVEGGFVTNNFSFSCGPNRYFLKQFGTASTERIHNITIAQSSFFNEGIPVIMPILNRHEETTFFFEGTWWGVFPFIDGDTCSSKELTTGHATQLGNMLGNIHKIGLTCNKEDAQPIILWNKSIFVSEKLALEYVYEREANKRDVETTAIQNLHLQKNFILNNPNSVAELRPENDCLIHGDFTHNNVFFTHDGRVQSVYDLDKTCVAPRGYEVARSILITCFDHGWDEKSFKLSDAFLRSYLAICPMSFEEFSHGFNIYVTHFMHTTWLEKKVILYKSKRHEPFIYSSHVRLTHLLSDYGTLAKRLYPKII